MKKLFSTLLVVVLVLTMSVSAMAAGTNTITVTGAQKGETYSIYKMLDLSVNEDKTAFTYTVNTDWATFFTGTGAGAAYVNIDEQGYVTWKDGMNTADKMEAFAKAAAAYAKDNNISTAVADIIPDADASIVFEGLESGYYLITSTHGTFAMVDTTPTNPDASVKEKNPEPTLTKEVQEDSQAAEEGNGWGEINSAQIGDTVEYKVTINVKEGAVNYVMHDQMDDGLTFNVESVEISGLAKDTDYTVSTDCRDECTFEIIFAEKYLNGLTADTVLTVTYNAVLNEKAVVGTAEENDAKITWGNSSTTEWDTTKTNTYKFEVLKYDGNDSTKSPLAGATFQLKNAAGEVIKLIKVSDTEYRVANGEEANAVDSFVTVAGDNIVITGVDLDKYTITETSAPAGYNKLENPIDVELNSENAVTVEVANNSGTELPSTGGIGTTIFYIAGGLMMAAAVVLLVTKKRMKSEG